MTINSIQDPPNNRVFYACQAVLYKQRNSTTSGGNDAANTSGFSFLTGVQSIGIDSSFTRENYADLGRFQQKFGSYGPQEFSMTIERVLSDNTETFPGDENPEGETVTSTDGPPLYIVADSSDYQTTHMLHKDNFGCCGLSTGLRNYDITLVYGSDANDYMQGGLHGTDSFMATTYRCCLLRSIGYNISVDGAITETLEFTSNIATQETATSGFTLPANSYPADYPQAGDLLKGRDISIDDCLLPIEVQRMFELGDTKENRPNFSDKVLGLQNISITIDIEYVDLLDVGKWKGSNVADGNQANRAKQNLYRQVGLPVGVSFSFTGIARAQYRGDVSGSSDPGTNSGRQLFENTDTTFSTADGDETLEGVQKYTTDREVRIVARKGKHGGTPNFYQWHLGQKNYLTGISYSGGDAGGGNVEVSMNYQNDHSDFVPMKSTTVRNITTTKTY